MAGEGQIRAVALGIFIRHNRIFVFEGYDKVKQELFYRPLGGGIEFGELGPEAVVREMKEETGADIEEVRYLATVENIFVNNGKAGHEIVQLYTATFSDPSFYNQEEIEAHEMDGTPFRALWKPLADFEGGRVPLYPTGLLELIKQKPV